MDTRKRPSAHQKKTSDEAVNVNKTEKVETGHGPVGAGGRPQGGSTPSGGAGRPVNTARPANTARPTNNARASGTGVPFSFGGGGSGNRSMGGGRLLPLLLVVVVAFLLLRSCGPQSSEPQVIYVTNPPAVATQVPVTATPAPIVTATPAPVITATPAPAVVNTAMRNRFYTPVGSGRDTVTIMVYMCGTDLESNYGMATSDLQEMASAKIGANVNVIVETGGCKLWKNKIVSNATNQIYKVESGGVRLAADNLGSKPMVDPSTLTEFIQFCQKQYPADRNILIFWDHGGGSVSGYGYDELYKSSGSMDLAEIDKALKAAGATFDWIGFDACLMATLETGMVCADYADYLIASEESEPGTGWYYTNWLTALSQNTSVDTVSLGKRIIDDFVSTSTAASASSKVSLSIVDLAELQSVVPAPFRAFSTSTTGMLQGSQYATVSNARASARQFAQSSRINQIDLVDFANRLGTNEARALSQAILSCVKHNNTNISHAYGLSVFFPYESMNSVKTAISTFQSVGMDEEYTKCISSFASLLSSGQLTASASNYSSSTGTGGFGLDLTDLLTSYLGSSLGGGSSYASSSSAYGSTDPLGSLLGSFLGGGGNTSSGYSVDPSMVMQLLSAFSGRSLPAEMDWTDADTMARSAQYVSENYIDPGDIFVTLAQDGTRMLSLTEEQWELIQTVELNVFVDDGEGFIDMGLDNTGFDWSDDGDMLMEFDGTWMCVNGVPVAYYLDSVTDDDTGYVVRGHIPALLTKTVAPQGDLADLDDAGAGTEPEPEIVTQLVNLQVVFDDENPYGVITGAQPMYEDGVGTAAKGEIALESGDVLEFLCDYYRYDGTFESTYKLEGTLTVDENGLEIVYQPLDERCSVTYRLTDIYNNHYWTPAWIY